MSYVNQLIDDPLFYWLSRENGHLIPADTRKTGIYFEGASGSGKTITAVRGVMAPNFKDRIPQFGFDPVGALIDDFLFTIFIQARQLRQTGAITADQEKLILKRIRYIDMSGRSGRVSKWPLFFKLPGDSYSDVAARLIDIFGLLDPALHNAPIHGMNALVAIAKPVVIVLTALGFGVTEAQEMLTLPKQAFMKQWEPRLRALKAESSAREVHQAVDFLLNHYLHLSGFEKERLTASFLAKLSLFDDSSMQAMYGASEPSVDWQEVVDRRQTLLLDFRFETNPIKRRFKMLHCYCSLRDFIIRRDVHERDKPLAVVIDELPELFAFDLGE